MINPSHLSLSQPSPKEVRASGCRTYRQYLSCNKNKLVLQTPDFQHRGLAIRTNNTLRSVCIPVEPWLRSQLDEIEKFVKDNVKIPNDVVESMGDPPKYKSLWSGENMYITISQWCSFFRGSDRGYEQLPADSHFGDGTYNINIEVPYVYIGPHKDGSSFSLTLRVVQIVYKPNLIALTPCSNLQVEGADATKTKKAKRSRKKKEDVSQVLSDFASIVSDCAL